MGAHHPCQLNRAFVSAVLRAAALFEFAATPMRYIVGAERAADRAGLRRRGRGGYYVVGSQQLR